MKTNLIILSTILASTAAFASPTYRCTDSEKGSTANFQMTVNGNGESVTFDYNGATYTYQPQLKETKQGLPYRGEKVLIYVAKDFSSVTFKDGNGEGGPILHTYSCSQE